MKQLGTITILMGLALGALAVSVCDNGTGAAGKVGSETHFLRTCASTCADGYSCVCGVCTTTCTDTAACTNEAAAATCTQSTQLEAAGACAVAPAVPTPICAVACTADVDCSTISED